MNHILRLEFLKLFYVSLFFLSRLMSPVSKNETRRDSSLTLLRCPYTVIKTVFMYFRVWFSWLWGWLQMWPKHVT